MNRELTPAGSADMPLGPLATLRRLTFAVLAVIVLCLATILGLLAYASQVQREQTAMSVERQFQGLLQLQAEQLQQRVQDYAYWDDAIENVVVKPDQVWWAANAGDYALASFKMSFSMAVSGRNEVILFSQLEGLGLDAAALGADPAWRVLMQKARAVEMGAAVDARAVSGTVRVGGELFTVAASRFRPESDESLPNPDPDALLVFAQSLDKTLLPVAAQIMTLPQWQRVDAAPASSTGLVLALADGQPAGVVTWTLPDTGRQIVNAVLPWLAGLLLVLVLVLAQAARRTALLARGIADMALKDSLTQLGNRRSLHQAAQRLADSSRPVSRFAVLMIDVDHFKRVNDQYGHERGDTVLADVARCIQQAARQGDYAIRYGGEEFAMVLDQVTQEQAVAVAERLHQRIRATRPGDLPITVSIGVSLSEDGAADLFRVINRADEALYKAKDQGRDRTVCG